MHPRAPPAPVHADQILEDVRLHGAYTAVRKLNPSGSLDETWDAVMQKVSAGEKAWLRVAVALQPGVDGVTGETLVEALFLALKPAPIPVLRLLQRQEFDTDQVCSSVIAIDYSSERSRRFIGERIKILTSVSDPTVRAARDDCLKGLRAALTDLAQEH